ncbi:hypothetical protein [Natrialba sp. INN-245]|uniref:hypothetical protein n=1 Tax=Natrialba sp. INN-245 TaxID=2690967 RepID=UPI00131116D8|nr:hypothetical protein [Natrialba sp. INN-245]MWV40778.1 hypothetical protein [Natrialba sp. INN-245]
MDRRSFLGGMSCSAGIVLSGCMDFDNSDDWETVRNCTEETAIRVESVGTALEDWLESPETFDSSRFDRAADETLETLENCESDVRHHYDDIEDETIAPEDELDQYNGKEVVAILEELFATAREGRTAATAVVEASGEPEELDAEEEETVESVTEEYDDVLEEVEPLIPDNTDS